MLNIFRRINTDDALILLILFIGAVLRCYRLTDIPFTHDELSAITRTHFLTFHELVEKGIKIDGHPAGIQVFLFYMVRIFGVSEVALKIPFILFGLLSVWIVYLVGKDWFNATVGLVAASFVSFLQFPVMYSQIARPYASGLFFAMLMVWFWTRVIFHPRRKYYLNLAGYVISGALCTYDHHFCMLFATMVGLTGLIYCPREKIVQYLAGSAMIIVLYLPHLPVFFYQLGIGGIEGWLGKPRFDFIADYIRYVFQFSVFVGLLVFILVSLSLYWYEEYPPVRKKFILISLAWFLIPYLAGYFYSTYRSAVLQYSVLIFSFPFLLFVLFGLFKTAKPLHKIVLVSLIGLVVIPSLVLERQHYRLFYRDAYPQMVAESKRMVDSLGPGRCLVILDTKKEINRYFLQKFNCPDLPFTPLQDFKTKKSLLAKLDASRADFLAFGSLSSTSSDIYRLALVKFPFLVRHESYAGGDFYLFSKLRPSKEVSEYFYQAVNTFDTVNTGWLGVNEKQCTDSLPIEGKRSFNNSTGTEFGPVYSKSLRDLVHSENDVIDVTVDVRTPLVFPGAWLVLNITSDGKVIKWNSAPVNEFVEPGHQGRVFQSLLLSDVDFRHHRMMFSAYLWNPTKSTYMMDNFTVQVRSGNPFLYGLYRKLDQ
jgi:hypothetical protein